MPELPEYEDSDFQNIYDYYDDLYDFPDRIDAELHWDVFSDLPGIEDLTYGEQLDMWRDYDIYMINGDGNDHEYFFDLYGIDEADFDWRGWAEAMGYE